MGLCGRTARNSHPTTPSQTDRTPSMNHRYQSATGFSRQQNGRPAYLAPPGVSVTSLLANLPQLSLKSHQSPIVLMDRYDYERLQQQTVQPGSSETCQYLLTAFDTLSRQGVIRFFDYTDFYQQRTQQTTVQQNRELMASLSDSIHRRTAISGNNRWVAYGRGQYQRSLRAGLDDDGFAAARQLDETRSQKIDRGLGTPREWNERVLHRYTAALTVRQQLDDILNLDVQHVIGEGESTLLNRVRAASDETFHIDRLAPALHIEDLMTSEMIMTRELLDQAGDIAVKRVGVQHDDWTLLGSTVALPRYADLFDFETIQEEIDDGLDEETLRADVERVRATLTQDGDTDHSSSTLTYTADWLAESTEQSFWSGREHHSPLADVAAYALNLAESSRAFRTVVERGEVSQTAAFIGLSLSTDPTATHDRQTLRAQCRHLLGQLAPPNIDQSQIDANLRRKDAWDREDDWYEVVDQSR